LSVPQLDIDSRERFTGRVSLANRLRRDPQALIAGTLLIIIIILGLLAPLLAGHGPNESDLKVVNADPGTPGYPLGADQSGRDIFSRLLYSVNTSMISGLIGAGVAVVIGVIFGLVGGYFGRRTSAATEWVFNLVMTFPGILFLIVLMPVTKGDFRVTMLIFGVLLSPNIFRIVRNLVIGVKNELYVDAARVSGLSNLRILGRHVLFVVRGPIIVASAFMFSGAIGVQSGLAFLGIGSNQVPSFGAMIGEGFLNLTREPLHVLWPSLVLGVITASLVLFGNSLRDALEGAQPKVARRSRAAALHPGTVDESSSAVLVIRDLAVAYRDSSGTLREVVRDVNLEVELGETVGLVGESGSGKTQTAFAILGLLPAEAVIARGSIRFDGTELLGLSAKELGDLRGRSIAYIPQEPMSNLDPSYRIGAQLVEGLRATGDFSRKAARTRILELLDRVGIVDPERTYDAYPHQISGGMAQRVLIAGAVASRPKLLIADEPTTALDVTIQAEILDLIRDLQQEMGMAVLLVTHNFGVVADICERIAVMRHGEVVETGPVKEIFATPKHPYTRMLLGAILDEDIVRSDPPTEAAATREETRS